VFKGSSRASKCPNLAKIAEVITLECCGNSSVVLIPYLNGALLGDKLLLSAVFHWIRLLFPNLSIWALDDGKCTFPMERFGVPPDRVISGSLQTTVSVGAEPRIGLILSLFDHNSTGLDFHFRPECRRISAEIWAVLSELASVGIFPKVKTHPANLMERPIGPPSGYFVVHIRALRRDELKNPDVCTLSAIASTLASHLLVPCFVVGRGDARDRIVNQHVFDLLYERPLSWEETIGLLHSACFFVGTDSGPRHLAAATGTPLICLDYQPSAFGPFCPAEQIISSRTLAAGRNGQLIASLLADARMSLEPHRNRGRDTQLNRVDNSRIERLQRMHS
jgi:hypothetical protein